ncbi:alpha/beta fold hydrolase [Chamaesiphon polymorphus]|uniref:Alpha/beta hydrolase n=1 Tax=Chamaesiphon polymorphus CCALA 037 TaxID=2107692 RepID=A0A2T1GG05_9CYAN|nr:alpha/beta hydrolase [Chamaesiphon polymorphus]PSB56483.1 alpha/beta hydrolase [Chamaesiphon polymorphus CCALA 037]
MPKVLWVSASPSLKYFHRHLLARLAKVSEIEFWEYYQTLDEGSSIDNAVDLLDEYLANTDRPVHLIGHGIGGVVALSYARKYPTRVASLVLLSVAVQPGINWHSYYYARLQSARCDRDFLLRSIAIDLFPGICPSRIRDLADRLDRDLVEAPSSHSLFRLDILTEGGVNMPVMIGGAHDDLAITSPALYGWTSYFKAEDKIWQIPVGGHFFHHFHPDLVGYQIQQFWQKLEPEIILCQLTGAEFN